MEGTLASGKPQEKELTVTCLQPARVFACATAVTQFFDEKAVPAEHLSFWDAIRALQHTDILLKPTVKTPQLVWYEGGNDPFHSALRNLMGNVDVPQEAKYPGEEREEVGAAFARAIQSFQAFLPRTYAAFTEVISFVILARRQGYSGGTVSSRIGLIWLAPEPSWSDHDWLENLVHEFVHNCLFLEDMVDSIFLAGGNRLDEDDAKAISAIRQVRRGYDKSYHSAFVSFAIVELYVLLGRPQKATEFLDPLLVCVEDLVQNTKFITDHGRMLLVELAGRLLAVRSQVKAAATQVSAEPGAAVDGRPKAAARH